MQLKLCFEYRELPVARVVLDISLGLVILSSFAGESTTLDLIILINLSPSSLIKY